jgi:hypothetical protein
LELNILMGGISEVDILTGGILEVDEKTQHCSERERGLLEVHVQRRRRLHTDLVSVGAGTNVKKEELFSRQQGVSITQHVKCQQSNHILRENNLLRLKNFLKCFNKFAFSLRQCSCSKQGDQMSL